MSSDSPGRRAKEDRCGPTFALSAAKFREQYRKSEIAMLLDEELERDNHRPSVAFIATQFQVAIGANLKACDRDGNRAGAFLFRKDCRNKLVYSWRAKKRTTRSSMVVQNWYKFAF